MEGGQQLMNFCLEPLMEYMRSDSVSADDHSPANLVAMIGSTRNRGFRVEHYIRPPITLALNFSVPVAVSCVLLCPDLQAQGELRLDLSGSNGRDNDQFRLCHSEVARGGDGDIVVALKSPMSWKRGAGALNVSSVMVCRSYAGGVLKRAKVHECWLKASPALNCCRHLQLRITMWTGTKPVTVKWMEVWGVLAQNCSPEETKLFQTKWNACGNSDVGQSSSLSGTTVVRTPHYFHSSDPYLNSLYHSHPDQSSHDLERTEKNSSLESSSSCREGGVVSVRKSKCVSGDQLQCGTTPAKLHDEITFEVMELPMILPSGHCVDQSTLDKLAKADAACGRPPTDPFTGLPFTELCKPSFSVELKALLDNYFSSTEAISRDRTVIARGKTVGSSKEIQRHLQLGTNRMKRPVENKSFVDPKRVKLNLTSSPSIDIGGEYPAPDAVSFGCSAESSLHDHTLFTSLPCGRIGSSPSSNHSTIPAPSTLAHSTIPAPSTLAHSTTPAPSTLAHSTTPAPSTLAHSTTPALSTLAHSTTPALSTPALSNLTHLAITPSTSSWPAFDSEVGDSLDRALHLLLSDTRKTK